MSNPTPAANARTAAITTASVLLTVPHVFAAERHVTQIALVGCGGRGTGAAGQALSVPTSAGENHSPLKLVAMADVFQHKMTGSYDTLSKGRNKDKVDVPPDRRFLGFDAYKKALDLLKPGDIAILTTPPAFRWPMFKHAIDKGLHVFMEKPVTVDGPTTRRMIALGEEAKKKNLKVGVGLMCRHCDARIQLHDRIKAGEIGDIICFRAYRMHGPGGFAGPKRDNISDLMYQIQRFHSFMWASGGVFSDYYIHNVDECCMMKDAWPVEAHGSGGRHFRGRAIDQNFDNYKVEYTFADGVKLLLNGRGVQGARSEFASYVHGSKGMAVISTRMHTPARCRIYKGHNPTRANLTWAYPEDEPDPYQLEWDHLIDAIRNDKPYNEVKRGAEASLVTAMGRFACHTGQSVTFDQMLNHDHEFAPGVDQLTPDSPPPLKPGPDGQYPQPQPGIKTNREY